MSARITRRAGRAMKPLSDYSPNIGGMDIGVSPATPAGERGHRGKGTPCLDAAVWEGLRGSPPDFYLLQCADHGVEPAGLDLRQTRDGGNLPRGHVSDTYPLRNLLPSAARRIS